MAARSPGGWSFTDVSAQTATVCRRGRRKFGLQVLLHIGDAKCGSSTIQNSLSSKTGHLLDQGILYHPAGPSIGHDLLATLTGDQTDRKRDELRKVAQNHIAETRSLIEGHGPQYLLLSAESFFVLEPERLINLVDQICGAPCPIHVLAFIRSHPSYYLTNVQQALRTGHQFRPAQEFRRDIATPLRRWKDHGRCSSLQVALCDRETLRGGSVVKEFAAMLGHVLGNDGPMLPDKSFHAVLSAEQMVVLQSLWREKLGGHPGKGHPEASSLVQLFQSLNTAMGGMLGTAPRLKPTVEAEILAQNRQSIAGTAALFPALGWDTPPSEDLNTTARTGSGADDDVGAILDHVDADGVAKIRALLPAFHPDLTQQGLGEALRRLNALTQHPAARPPYLAYLQRCGLGVTIPGSRQEGIVKPKRILILGTSNSILKNGWTTGFAEGLGPDVTVVNRSIGGSPGSQFARWCSEDLSDFDCVILDSVVNDENMIQRDQLGDYPFYAQLLYEIMSTISSQTHLVVLGFCNERFAERRSAMFHIHRATARYAGAEFESVIDFIRKFGKPWFRDPAHISVDLARKFGQVLGAKLQKGVRHAAATPSFARNFTTIKATESGAVEIVSKANSIMALDLVRLRDGDVLNFPEDGRLIGMEVDSVETYGFVEFSGSTEACTQSVRFPKVDKSILVFFVPVAGGVRAGQLRVTRATSGPFRKSMHDQPSGDRQECGMLLSSLTFWSAER